jgi:hypothetical protein
MTITVPKIDPLSQILPEEPLLMMGAGPVPIPGPVAAANGIVINHLGIKVDLPASMAELEKQL